MIIVTQEKHSPHKNLYFMYANLFCKGYRSIIAFAVTILLSSQYAIGQKVFYSSPERTTPSEAKSYIIGDISSNTIIWQYNPQAGRSQILVYDGGMHLINRVKADVFASPQIYQLSFIKRQNSFDVIAQTYTKQSFYCQLASFNGSGILLGRPKTLIDKSLANTFLSGSYDCIISANKKYFALVKDKVQVPANEIQLDCSLYYNDDSLQNIATKTITIPYYKDINTLFSPLNIDNTGNIFFAEYVSQSKDINSHVIVYKCAQSQRDYTSCTVDITNKKLADLNIKLDNYNRQCIVYALWSPQNNLHTNPPNQQDGGVFSWAVNATNMEGAKKDTAYQVSGINNLQVQQWKNENALTKDAIALKDNTYTLAVTTVEGHPKNMYSDEDNDAMSGYYINAASYTPGLYDASNPQAAQVEAPKKGSKYVGSYSSYAYRNGNYVPKKDAKGNRLTPPEFNANLLLLRIDNTSNNVMWSQSIKSDHDQNAFSFVNKYSLLNAGDALYFICKKFLAKDKESFESIKLSADGEISVRQIMSRNTDYEIMVDYGVQVNSHTMIFPCIFQDKTLAYARYEIE